MNWFKRNQPPTDVVAQAEAALGRKLRVRAWGSGENCHVLGANDALLIGRDGEWTEVEWHLIRSGGWKADISTLRWDLSSGEADEVKLDDEGRLPELFRERVQASIVVEEWIDAPGRGKVLIAGRRRLGNSDEAQVVWQAAVSGGANLSDPETAALVLARTKALRGDYEL